MDKKDFLSLSLTIFRHSLGISFWTKSEPTKLEEKVDAWKTKQPKEKGKKTVVKGGHFNVSTKPAEPVENPPATWGTAMPKDTEEKPVKK